MCRPTVIRALRLTHDFNYSLSLWSLMAYLQWKLEVVLFSFPAVTVGYQGALCEIHWGPTAPANERSANWYERLNRLLKKKKKIEFGFYIFQQEVPAVDCARAPRAVNAHSSLVVKCKIQSRFRSSIFCNMYLYLTHSTRISPEH